MSHPEEPEVGGIWPAVGGKPLSIFVILIIIRENKAMMLNWCLLYLLNWLDIITVTHNFEIDSEEATLKSYMLEPARAVLVGKLIAVVQLP